MSKILDQLNSLKTNQNLNQFVKAQTSISVDSVDSHEEHWVERFSVKQWLLVFCLVFFAASMVIFNINTKGELIKAEAASNALAQDMAVQNQKIEDLQNTMAGLGVKNKSEVAALRQNINEFKKNLAEKTRDIADARDDYNFLRYQIQDLVGQNQDLTSRVNELNKRIIEIKAVNPVEIVN